MSQPFMRAVVDRIEGSIAVLLVGEPGAPLHLPLRELPPGVTEGTVLTLSFAADPDATRDALQQARARIQRLRDLSRKR